jgi:hypothetical protein
MTAPVKYRELLALSEEELIEKHGGEGGSR